MTIYIFTLCLTLFSLYTVVPFWSSSDFRIVWLTIFAIFELMQTKATCVLFRRINKNVSCVVTHSFTLWIQSSFCKIKPNGFHLLPLRFHLYRDINPRHFPCCFGFFRKRYSYPACVLSCPLFSIFLCSFPLLLRSMACSTCFTTSSSLNPKNLFSH